MTASGTVAGEEDSDDTNSVETSVFEEETRNQVQVGETAFGSIAYHSGYKNESILKLSCDPDEILSLHEEGWDVSPGKTQWILRAPEAALCDFSNPLRNPTEDPADVMCLHDRIRDGSIDELLTEVIPSDLTVYRLEGESLETTEKIAGSDHRVVEIPSRLYDRVTEARCVATDRRREQPQRWDIWEKQVDDLSVPVQKKWEGLAYFYDQISNVAISSTAIGGFWNQLPEADINVFVPKAGIAYYLGYLEETGNTNAALWEYHRGINPTKEVKFFDQSFADKRVNIIDKAYSGGTVEAVGKRVRNEGGQPRLISVFPKSAQAVEISDHVVFWDRVLPADTIETSADGWYQNTFETVTRSRSK